MRMKNKIRLTILEIVMLLATLLVFIPLLIMVLGSFKDPAEAAQFSLALPKHWLGENYVFVYQAAGILKATINSLIVTTCAVTLSVICAALAAFTISRKQSRFTTMSDHLFMMGMVAPIQIITTFGLMRILHLSGTYLGVILIFSAIQLPWGIFMFTGFIKSIPLEMDEAAFIDGCGAFQMFFLVILPLLKPVVMTTLVMITMYVWNDFQIPLYFFNSSSRWTLPLTVYNFFGQYFNNWNYVFANLVMVALPITLLYLYTQKYIVSGMTAGAVKG